jgi:hypothetical protein
MQEVKLPRRQTKHLNTSRDRGRFYNTTSTPLLTLGTKPAESLPGCGRYGVKVTTVETHASFMVRAPPPQIASARSSVGRGIDKLEIIRDLQDRNEYERRA